jgi:hypothetical protein
MKKQLYWIGGMLATALLPALPGIAQVSIPATATPVVVNFDGFAGTGFQASPDSAQLDSDDWASTGMSDGAMNFGDSKIIGDYARGTTAGGVSSGGFYALTYSGNVALMAQPTSSDFNPGTLTLRLQNNSGETIVELDADYDLVILNNEDRASSFNFSYSVDDATYTSVPALDYTSDLLRLVGPAIVVPRSTTITGLNVADGQFIYLRWNVADAGGAGSRDELGLDNISVTAAGGASVAAFNFDASSLSVSEADSSVNVSVSLSEAADCGVDVSLIGGSASNGLDYQFTSPTTLSYTSGGGLTASFAIDLLDDLLLEGSESFTLEITNATGGCLIGAVSQLSVAILDDESAPLGACQNLYFSEYIEGSSNNKAIEIYNPTSSTIDLSAYSVKAFNNGVVIPTNSLFLSGSLAPGGVYVIANASSDSSILAVADTTSSITNFNGDDAVVLLNGGDTIDAIGIVGVDPGTNWAIDTLGATSEYTLVRKPAVNSGQLNWGLGALEWLVYPQNTFSFLGAHIQDPCPVVCSTDSLASNQMHTLLGTVVKLEWTPPVGVVGCQVEGQRLPSGPSPNKNIVSAPYNSLVVPRALAGAGTTWTWRVRCACSLDPLVAGAYTTYGDTFMIPAEKLLADLGSIELYPNPASDQIVFNYYSEETANVSIEIMDMTGRLIEVSQVSVVQGNQPVQIDVTTLNPGLYILRVDGTKGTQFSIVR